MPGWRVVTTGYDVHCLPAGEKHRQARDCECDPTFEDEYGNAAWTGDRMPLVVIHQARDGRE